MDAWGAIPLLAQAADAARETHIHVPGGSKWVIGFLGLFHTAVASASIGFAFIVTVLQVTGYRLRDNRYDLMGKRVQLWHVCIYNIGTINAIGLVFALGGLYPEFWTQIFTHFFWTLIVEELLFFLLATTLTFHYFFWDMVWGHKKLHIFLGALLTPLFFLQFFLINGMGAFILTPGLAEASVSQWQGTAGVTGWDLRAFYNPSFLGLTLHRLAANFAYGSFIVAAVCGISLLRGKQQNRAFYESGGRMAFHAGFVSFLALPIIGYFYAHAIMRDPHGYPAYVNLMWGKGDIVAGGIDWWWLKHCFVAGMLGAGLTYLRRLGTLSGTPSVTSVLIWAVAGFYLVFYLAMGYIMTWLFFWAMLAAALAAAGIARFMLRGEKPSGGRVFLLMGCLSVATVLLGGYAREASRPRFVSGNRAVVRAGGDPNRYAPYDEVYVPAERQTAPGPMAMVLEPPPYVATMPARPKTVGVSDRSELSGAALTSRKCIHCHTLQRVWDYREDDWGLVVERMAAYGVDLNNTEARRIVEYLRARRRRARTRPAK